MNTEHKRNVEINVLIVLSAIILIGVLFALGLQVAAQDTSPVATVPDNVTSPSEVVNMLVASLIAITAIPGAAGATQVLTALIKRVLPDELLSADSLSNLLTVIMYAIFWGAVHLGLKTQFDIGIDLVYQIGTVVLGLIGTKQTAQLAYKWAYNNNVQILGYSRSPENQ